MLRIGHRGASGSAPENTLTSFKKALALGADGVELDVHCCKGGELVVIHDDTVDRTTNGKGKVAELTLTQLAALKIEAIESSEHIPTLGEVIKLIGREPYCFIEIKHADAAVPVAKLIETYVDEGWRPERLILISFNHEALQEARKTYSRLVIGASFEQLSETGIKKAKAFGARFILPNYRMLKESDMRSAKESELLVIPWTVNDRIDIGRTRLMGVHGIISDYPERLSGDGYA